MLHVCIMSCLCIFTLVKWTLFKTCYCCWKWGQETKELICRIDGLIDCVFLGSSCLWWRVQVWQSCWNRRDLTPCSPQQTKPSTVSQNRTSQCSPVSMPFFLFFSNVPLPPQTPQRYTSSIVGSSFRNFFLRRPRLVLEVPEGQVSETQMKPQLNMFFSPELGSIRLWETCPLCLVMPLNTTSLVSYIYTAETGKPLSDGKLSSSW